MHPMSLICSGVFMLLAIAAVMAIRNDKRARRERVLIGVLSSFGVVMFLFVPGMSPIRGAIDATKVTELCRGYAVGRPSDPEDFKRKADSFGLRSIVSEEKQFAHADAVVILKVRRVCDVEFADGRVTSVSSQTHAP